MANMASRKIPYGFILFSRQMIYNIYETWGFHHEAMWIMMGFNMI
jgi:hypothetical protein